MLNVRDQLVTVVGAGKIATGKMALLREQGARIRVIAPDILGELPVEVELIQRPYEEGDVSGSYLVICATGVPAVNEIVVADCHRLGILVNVVDVPDLCDFYFTAVHRVGDVVVSVSSQGTSPALAQVVRNHIKESLPSTLADISREVRAERDRLHAQNLSTEGRPWREFISELWQGRQPTSLSE